MIGKAMLGKAMLGEAERYKGEEEKSLARGWAQSQSFHVRKGKRKERREAIGIAEDGSIKKWEKIEVR